MKYVAKNIKNLLRPSNQTGERLKGTAEKPKSKKKPRRTKKNEQNPKSQKEPKRMRGIVGSDSENRTLVCH